MIVTMCDGCGRRLSAWVSVDTKLGADRDFSNVGNLLRFENGRFHFCEDCAAKRFDIPKGEDDT